SPTCPSPVCRCSTTPLTVTSVAALTTVVPAVEDVICTEHEPVAAIVVHVFTPPTNEPGPLTIENVINVPAGAFEHVTPSGATFTWPVSTWFEPIGFVACAGEIWIFASGVIQTLFASTLSPA